MSASLERSVIAQQITTPDSAVVRTPSPASAMLFLYARTFSNRLKSQLTRIRSPRYVAAVIMGVLYIWWALFRNSRFGGGPLAMLARTDELVPVFAAFLLLSAARWWIFGAERSTLAFAPAEVQFLFPAPVSRRALIHAKLLRTQIAILLNTVIWSVLLRGDGGSLEGWRRGFSLWIVFSVLALHRLGASIVRANAIEHENAGRRRSVVPLLVFAGLVGAVVYGLLSQYEALKVAAEAGMRAVGNAILVALNQPIPSYALWPVRALLEPVFARSGALWITAAPIAFVILLLHYLWVVRLDASFEEAALEATQHRAERLQRFRTSQMGKSRSRGGKLARVPKLALTGRPEVAIAWKNVAAAMRGGAWRTQLIAFTLGLASLAIVTRSASARAGDVFLGVTMGWGAMLLFLGPLWMRFDLRLDLQRLAILKTMPLSGLQVVTAEIAGVTILHTLTVWSLMIVPLVMIILDPSLLTDSGLTIPILFSVALAVPVFNALMFAIQNGTALLFPAWVRLGAEARGFETMGQNLLTTGATTLVATVALVFPVGIGALTIWLSDVLDSPLGVWSVLLGTVLGCLILALEIWPLLIWLGTVFEKTDLSDVTSGN